VSWLDAHEPVLEFIEAIRCMIGLRPLPDEEAWRSSFTLDGKRKLTAAQWASRLGISRQAVAIRRKVLAKQLAAGVSRSLAFARASCPARAFQSQKKTKRAEPRAGRPLSGSAKRCARFRGPHLGGRSAKRTKGDDEAR